MRLADRKRGQVGLMLLVIMGVVVALALSVASRSLSDTVLSRQERESSAAFNVAESGVEQALNSLRQGSVPSGAQPLGDSSGFVTGQFAVQQSSSYALFVKEGELAYLDLAGYASPTVTISWTKASDPSENVSCNGEGSGNAPAAIEVISLQTGSNTVQRIYYNPANCSISGNGFSGSNAGSEYRSTVTYAVPFGTTALRVRPIYNGATLSVTGVGLTTQLYLIQSTASGGDAQKDIEARRGLDAPGSVFDYAVFSGSTLVK